MLPEIIPSPALCTPDGRTARIFRLTNRQGASVDLCEWGARWMQARVPGRDGRLGDTLQGYVRPEEWLTDDCYRGATIGRYANRIGGAEVTVDGVRYALDRNDGPNCNHGGRHGLNTCLWQGIPEEDGVSFTLTSPHLAGGWPGEVTLRVSYRWDDNNRLLVTHEATTDRPTWLSLTLHPYFNLGNRPGSVADHLLYIPSTRRLEMDAAFLPTGRLVEVQGTPFDFTRPARIGQYAGQLCDELVWSRGYNHCYPVPDPAFPDERAETLSPTEGLPLAASQSLMEGTALTEGIPLAESLPLAAQLTAPDSGRVLSIYTDLPGILVYSGGFLPQPESAVALEAQFWPDTPGHADFPSCLLRPGMRYLRHICFAFGISQA